MTQPTVATTPPQIYLTVRGGAAAIVFYTTVFGAVELAREVAEDGTRLLHAELQMLGGEVMLSDEFPEYTAQVLAPPTLGGTSVTLHINLKKRAMVDAILDRAAAAGARITMPAQKMFWGAYYGRLIDPFGHAWSFAADEEGAQYE